MCMYGGGNFQVHLAMDSGNVGDLVADYEITFQT